VPVSDGLRARARENRRLYLRAGRSPKDLGRFVADSLALVKQMEDEVMSSSFPDPNLEEGGIATCGALAVKMDSGGRIGLNWKGILSVAGSQGRPLVHALDDFRGDDLGAWIAVKTDYGGCHQPEDAEPALRHLVDAWNAAPVPIRNVFRRYVIDQLHDMARAACFCDGEDKRDKIQGALDRNGAILDGLPTIGPDIARKLRALPSKSDSQFRCGRG
jgi:hypothetical protein